MDKEQFDHIENLIRQAAESVSPAANDEAWKKMEVLLDKEFRKNRRRRIIWWWPLILLTLSITGIFYYYQTRQQVTEKFRDIAKTSKIDTQVDESNSLNLQKVTQKKQKKTARISIKSKEDVINNKLVQNNQSVSRSQLKLNPQAPIFKKNNKIIKLSKGRSRRQNTNRGTVNNIDSKENFNNEKKDNYRNKERGIFEETVLTKRLPPLKLITNSSGRIGPIGSFIPDVSKLNFDSALENKNNKGAQSKNTSEILQSTKRIYIIASVSPDASAIKKIKFNNVNIKYGLGIGYHLNKKLSLQTGFYAGKKIYTAVDGDYTIKPGSYIAKIIRINADCYVYDIPLSVRYDVLQRNRYNVYAITGISSFWSKRETYDYHFLNRSGMYRSMISTFKNNTNVFSIFNLSMGFERSLSDAFYLQAEPYVNVPISGLGEGKVRLYSAGLQLGVKYQPLKKPNKK